MSAPIPSDVQRLAIELPSWVGDSVMATPVLRASRARCPEAIITGVMRPNICELLTGCPYLDEIVSVDSKAAHGVLRTARAYRKAQAILLLPNSFRSGLAAWISRAPVRVGYVRDGRGMLLTHRLRPDGDNRPVPAIEYYARLAEFAFSVESIDRGLELAVTDAERDRARSILAGVSEPLGVLNPGGVRAAKRWPAERFAAVGDHLFRRHGLSIVLSGSPAEHAIIESVCSAMRSPAVNLVERGANLSDLKAVLERAAILVTNDTGPRHIAAALGTPVVTLFGPTDHRWTTLEGVAERILLANPFLPDHLVADDYPAECSIDRIPIADVIESCEVMLAVGSWLVAAATSQQPTANSQ